MAQSRRAILGGLAVALMPAVALGFFVAVLRDSLGTTPALVDALTSVPLWAQVYLALTVTLALGLPAVVLAVAGETSRDPERTAPRQSWRDPP